MKSTEVRIILVRKYAAECLAIVIVFVHITQSWSYIMQYNRIVCTDFKTHM